MTTSGAAVEDAVDVCVLGFSLGTGLGVAGDAEEGIADRVGGREGIQRFQVGGLLARWESTKRSPLATRRKTPSASWRNSSMVTVFME